MQLLSIKNVLYDIHKNTYENRSLWLTNGIHDFLKILENIFRMLKAALLLWYHVVSVISSETNTFET